ncbi:MAG: SRPBCC domain-containing protein [Burkholderiales bacterium]
MIEVRERVEVPSAPETVWELLTDPHAVVNCVPGATLGDQHEDGSFDGSLTVKFGPAKVTFHTRVALELDAAAKVGHVTARGKDNQGGTRVRATMTFKVIERIEARGTTILIDAQVEISGRLALVVEAGASMVVKRMTREFSEQLAARYAGPVPGEASA